MANLRQTPTLQPPHLQPTQNLYTILGLPTPTHTSNQAQPLTTSQIKAAYRRALLKHHPDKARALNPSTPANRPHDPTPLPPSRPHQASPASPQSKQPPSIDAITHARNILSNPSSRRAYDIHLQSSRRATGAGAPSTQIYSETVDLDDMIYKETTQRSRSRSRSPSPLRASEDHDIPQNGKENGVEEGGAVEAGIWTRLCRCGDEGGFVVTEADLLGALEVGRAGAEDGRLDEGRGEVLVGCRGCSLVIRVLFWAVDEGGGEAEEMARNADVLPASASAAATAAAAV